MHSAATQKQQSMISLHNNVNEKLEQNSKLSMIDFQNNNSKRLDIKRFSIQDIKNDQQSITSQNLLKTSTRIDYLGGSIPSSPPRSRGSFLMSTRPVSTVLQSLQNSPINPKLQKFLDKNKIGLNYVSQNNYDTSRQPNRQILADQKDSQISLPLGSLTSRSNYNSVQSNTQRNNVQIGKPQTSQGTSRSKRRQITVTGTTPINNNFTTNLNFGTTQPLSSLKLGSFINSQNQTIQLKQQQIQDDYSRLFTSKSTARLSSMTETENIILKENYEILQRVQGFGDEGDIQGCQRANSLLKRFNSLKVKEDNKIQFRVASTKGKQIPLTICIKKQHEADDLIVYGSRFNKIPTHDNSEITSQQQKIKITGINEQMFSCENYYLGVYSQTGCQQFGLIYSFRKDIFYKPNWNLPKNEEGLVIKKKHNGDDDSLDGHGEHALSPEQIEWRRQREKIEARKNFKQYTMNKITKIMSEPGQYNKLMRKIDDIKQTRIQLIKKRGKLSDDLEVKILSRKVELMQAKEPGQTIEEFKRVKVIERREEIENENLKKKVFLINKQQFIGQFRETMLNEGKKIQKQRKFMKTWVDLMQMHKMVKIIAQVYNQNKQCHQLEIQRCLKALKISNKIKKFLKRKGTTIDKIHHSKIKSGITLSAMLFKETTDNSAKNVLFQFLHDKAKIKSMRNQFVRFYNRITSIQRSWREHLQICADRKTQIQQKFETIIETMRNRIIKAKGKNKKQYAAVLNLINFLDQNTKERVINEYVQELKLRHTIEIIKWYAQVNQKADLHVLQLTANTLSNQINQNNQRQIEIKSLPNLFPELTQQQLQTPSLIQQNSKQSLNLQNATTSIRNQYQQQSLPQDSSIPQKQFFSTKDPYLINNNGSSSNLQSQLSTVNKQQTLFVKRNQSSNNNLQIKTQNLNTNGIQEAKSGGGDSARKLKQSLQMLRKKNQMEAMSGGGIGSQRSLYSNSKQKPQGNQDDVLLKIDKILQSVGLQSNTSAQQYDQYNNLTPPQFKLDLDKDEQFVAMAYKALILQKERIKEQEDQQVIRELLLKQQLTQQTNLN
eukprot:403353841